MLRKYLPLLLTSLTSATLAILGYHWLAPPREVIVREPAPVQYTYNNIDNDGLTQAGRHVYQSAAPTNFIQAAQLTARAVVNIKSIQRNRNLNFLNRGDGVSSTGSGVLVSAEGFIVTNHHVVERGDDILVTLADNQELPADLIGSDPSTDLALLRIKGNQFPFLRFGNSDSVQVGEWVLAVGNPFNLQSTVTAGIVSAKGRSIDILDTQDRIESFIQTDAAVNPGNSGGALINTQGELIGINTAIITQTGHYEGYSFAVPSNLVRKVIRDLQDYGTVQRGLLGVFIEEVNSNRAAELGLARVEGVYITRITPGSGAADAGLQPGDVITGINGIRTPTLPAMQELVGRYRPGNVLRIQYIRRKKSYTTQVTLKNKSNNTGIVRSREQAFLRKLGLEARNLSSSEVVRWGAAGVKITSIYRGSQVYAAQIRPDFIITKINDTPVRSIEDLIFQLQAASGERAKLEGFYPNEKQPRHYWLKTDLGQ